MKPIRILLALCALAITGALLAGCGDDDDASDADPQTVLEDTFNNETRLTSGNLTLSASVEAEGEQGGSFEGSLSGPYQADPENPAAIPQVDWSVSSSGEIAGEPLDFEGGLVLTDDNAFVEYGGATYEVGAETYAPIKEQLDAQAAATDTESATSFQAACEQALSQAGASDASACDIDPIGWLSNVTNEGTEDVGGAESVHIHGDANLDQILEDIGGFISAIPGAAAEIDPAQISLLEGAVETASVDVYSTEDENLLSKLDVNLTLDLGAFAGSGAPVSTVDITFGYEVADINEEQTIEAPADAQPIEELVGDLGVNLDDLGGLGGLGGAGGGGGGGGGGGAPNTDAYLECLQQAGSDADAINDCASEL
ncbi:MAG TPA: hypothetical protein VHF58_03155 [Solirubrobacterales bacterium]|nr:hypothetical protein [Solirubrobacterales bacterium]